MKTCALLAMCCLFIVSVGKGQQTKIKESTLKFSSILQAGFLGGEKGNSYLLQTINGVRKDKWFTGIGTGIDFYNERGVPLFVDVRRDLMKNNKTPFVYADGGVNFEWLNFIQKEQRSLPKSSAGLYYDVGAGWKLGGKNKGGFIVSAGYSFKQAKERSDLQVFNPATQTYQNSLQHMNYKYRRVSLKIGLQF